MIELLTEWNRKIAQYVYDTRPVKAVYATNHPIPNGHTYVYRTDGWRDVYIEAAILDQVVQRYAGFPVLTFHDITSGTDRISAVPVYRLDD